MMSKYVPVLVTRRGADLGMETATRDTSIMVQWQICTYRRSISASIVFPFFSLFIVIMYDVAHITK